MSDTLSLGDIAELSQSNALAFRIVLPASKLPPRSELYWRAMVLDQFDGQTWKSNEMNQQWVYSQPTATANMQSVSYTYLQADPEQRWIMGLEHSVPANNRYVLRLDGSIIPSIPVQSTQPIPLRWISAIAPQKNLPPYMRQMNVTLPETDPKTRALAQQLYVQSAEQPERYIQNVLNWYRKNNFKYSLTPGKLQGNRVDQFLFETRIGFCEHFASSFVMLMRAAEIPARIVVGYQGGQAAPDGQSWEVRQLDAHAWAEVWINQRWQRVDPTALVAPQRINDGMQNYLNEGTQQSRTGVLGRSRLSWMNQLRIWSDYASYQWQSKVVGYDVEQQRGWLKLWGINSQAKLIWVLVLTIISFLLLYIAVIVWRNRSQHTQYEKLLIQFNRTLDKDLQKQSGETFQMWMQRLSFLVSSEQQEPFKQVVAVQQYLIFKEKQQDKSEAWAKFAALLKECSFILKNRRKILSNK